jgi:hypothetical protein
MSNNPTGGPDEKEILSDLGRHIVAICGSYVPLNNKGEPSDKPSFYSYTGTVFELLGAWYIVTAGHVLRRLEEATNSPAVRIEAQVLADYFGVRTTNRMPLPFKPLEQHCSYIDDDSLGLDFGLVSISPLFRKNLDANGILPLSSRQWNFPSAVAFEQHGVVGFPDEYTDGFPSSSGASMVGWVKPTYVPIRRIADDTSKKFARFKGEIIDRGDQESIRGMSGGPIFGFYREGQDTKYLLEALQVEWDRSSLVYGCPVKAMMGVLQARLEEYLRAQAEK